MIKHKYFISEYNEEKWLNQMGGSGFKLVKKSFFTYEFESTDKTYKYRIDFLPDPVEAEESVEYLKDKHCCGNKGSSVYILNMEHTVETASAHEKRYSALAMFFGVCFLFFAALFTYNVSCMSFFDAEKYVIKTDVNEIWSIFNFIVGKNPAALFLWVIMPFLLVSGIYGLIFYFEKTRWTKLKTKISQSTAVGSDTEVSDTVSNGENK